MEGFSIRAVTDLILSRSRHHGHPFFLPEMLRARSVPIGAMRAAVFGRGCCARLKPSRAPYGIVRCAAGRGNGPLSY